MREWLDEMLAEGKIRPSKLPCRAPLFMVDKDASLEKGRYDNTCDLLLTSAALIRSRFVIAFSLPSSQSSKTDPPEQSTSPKIDLKSGFNLVRIKEGDE